MSRHIKIGLTTHEKHKKDFTLKFMINGTILILIKSISPIWMAMSPSVPSSKLSDFNCRNKVLTDKLLRQGYRYHKLHKLHKLRQAFSKFYRRHSALVTRYNVSLKELSQQDISEQEFYGDLVYRIRNLWENLIFRKSCLVRFVLAFIYFFFILFYFIFSFFSFFSFVQSF